MATEEWGQRQQERMRSEEDPFQISDLQTSKMLNLKTSKMLNLIVTCVRLLKHQQEMKTGVFGVAERKSPTYIPES